MMGRDSQSIFRSSNFFGGIWFVPAGLFLGLGIGLLIEKRVEVTLLGVGFGFLGYGLSWILKRPNN